jgi:hypothetical protein
MKKLLLVLSLTVIGLSGCYVVPYGGHDDGYRRDGEHHDDGDHNRNHEGHDGGQGGEHDHND